MAQRIVGSRDGHMPHVPLRAFVVYHEALLRVCPKRGTLFGDIICVADRASGHN
ncbi:MAG TPA: hypothetical protein VJQ25_06810 [Nitrospira sp.]|nr:hypothetical protein [Nitrospira sp.]